MPSRTVKKLSTTSSSGGLRPSICSAPKTQEYPCVSTPANETDKPPPPEIEAVSMEAAAAASVFVEDGGERVDVATSPMIKNLYPDLRKASKCSHIRRSHNWRRRRSSAHDAGVASPRLLSRNSSSRRTRSKGRSSRSFSVVTLQNYLFWFSASPTDDGLDFIDDDDLSLMEDLEPGCCNVCWDGEVALMQIRPRPASVSACKFQAFGLAFCLLGAGTFFLQQVSKDNLCHNGCWCRCLDCRTLSDQVWLDALQNFWPLQLLLPSFAFIFHIPKYIVFFVLRTSIATICFPKEAKGLGEKHNREIYTWPQKFTSILKP